MKNLITIDPKKNTASILLGENYESFKPDTKDWQLKHYVQQWQSAIRLLLDTGSTVCLIKHYEAAKQHVKQMGIYTIFSQESAYPCEQIDNDKFFITECFIFITERVEHLSNQFYFDKIFDHYDHHFPIYYFNPNHIEHFYLYLSERTNGISVWEVSRQQLATVFELNI